MSKFLGTVGAREKDGVCCKGVVEVKGINSRWFVSWKYQPIDDDTMDPIKQSVEDLRCDEELRELYLELKSATSSRLKADELKQAAAPYCNLELREDIFKYAPSGGSHGSPAIDAISIERASGKKRSSDGSLKTVPTSSANDAKVWFPSVTCLSGVFDSESETCRDVDKLHYCRGPNSKCHYTSCYCLFGMLCKHQFAELLIMLDQVRELRKVMKSGSYARTKEAFHSVFGISPIRTYGSGLGTRGLFYYFQDQKCLGTLCHNAMYVVLSKELWSNFTFRHVHDAMRERGDAIKIKKTDDWIVSKKTVQSYIAIDFLVGYAELLKTNCVSIPTRSCVCKCIGASGLQQQPTAMSHHTARKSSAIQGISDFLCKYDDSITRIRKERVSRYLTVANPGRDNGVVFGDEMHSETRVSAIHVGASCKEAINELLNTFLVLYGSDGRKQNATQAGFGLQEVHGCPGLAEWSSGDFSVGVSETILSGDSLKLLAHAVSEYIVTGVEACESRRVARLDCHWNMKFKVNRSCGPQGRVQMPHYVMDPAKVALLESQITLVRAILPLDRSGLVLRVWPNGIEHDTVSTGDRLVYVQPGTMLILPVGVATSDCIRFSPQGQRRAEFVFAFVKKGKRLPKDCTLEDDYVYFKCDGPRARKQLNSVAKSRAKVKSVLLSNARYVNPILKEFIELFPFFE